MCERHVRSLNEVCATRLPDAQMLGIVRLLAELARDKDQTFAQLRRNRSEPQALRRHSPRSNALVGSVIQVKGSRICSNEAGVEKCRDNYPVRERARESLERINHRLERVREHEAPRRSR